MFIKETLRRVLVRVNDEGGFLCAASARAEGVLCAKLKTEQDITPVRRTKQNGSLAVIANLITPPVRGNLRRWREVVSLSIAPLG